MKLASDRELTLSSQTRQVWWQILWSAYLEWPYSPWTRKELCWPIASLLLGNATLRREALLALATVYLQHPGRPLYLYNCRHITTADLALLAGLESLKTLELFGCYELNCLPDLSGLKGLRNLELVGCQNLKGEKALRGLTELKNLEFLSLLGCQHLHTLPDLSHMQRLRMLNLRFCTNLRTAESLQGLTGLVHLEVLNLQECIHLEQLPDFSRLQGLRELTLTKCPAAKHLNKLKAQLHSQCDIVTN